MMTTELSYEFIGFSVLAVTAVLFYIIRQRSKNDQIPMVKGGIFFFGHVATMLKGSPWDTMAQWVHEYGTIFRLHINGSDAISVSDPRLLKIVLHSKLSNFKKDLVWTYKPFMVLLGNGLVTADGAEWRRQRTLVSAHLRIDILNDIPIITLAAVKRLCIKLDRLKASGETIEMAEEFRHLVLQVIAEAILSIPHDESDRTFAKMYLPIVEEGNLRIWHPERMYLPLPSWFKFRRDVEKLNNYVLNIIRQRWQLRKTEKQQGQSTRRQDVLDKALSSVESEELPDDAAHTICDQIKTFILAGHETSASMLTWTLFELSRPENLALKQKVLVESKVVYESCIDSKTNQVTTAPPRAQIDKLVYSECCLREGLRKYSVIPSVVRIADEAIQMDEYYLEKGSTIFVNMQGVHHNPDFWPEPLNYKPERFLEEIAPYTFLPFIEGPRNCLGQYLSLLESKMILSMLLSTYQFELVNEAEAAQKHAFMVPIIPKFGHHMRIH